MIKVCAICKKEKKHYARGMCNPCYQRESLAKKDKDENYYLKKRLADKVYYSNNKVKILNRLSEWRSKNIELSRKRVREATRALRRRYKEEGLNYNDAYLFGGMRTHAYERDAYKCVDCGITNSESLEKYRQKLCIHHIDGMGFSENKKTKNNSPENLVTLCPACHGREHRRLSEGRGRKTYTDFVL